MNEMIKLLIKPGMVVYTCNPSYLGDRNREDHSLRPAHLKNKAKTDCKCDLRKP
jgi:hypothetical protein